MMQRIQNGMEITKQSLAVLRESKELVVFPLISGVACLLVLISFAVPLFVSGNLEMLLTERPLNENPGAMLTLFLFYFVNYFIIVFFNAALTSCAVRRLRGWEMSVVDGLRDAVACLPQIIGWAALSATVGLVLRAIESRSQKLGQLVAALLGLGWTIASYFVVPVLVVEGLGPVAAVRRSFGVLRKTWGESLVSNIGVGFLIGLAMIVAVIPTFIGISMGGDVAPIVGILITVLLAIAISLTSSALHAITLAALYLYAAKGKVSDHYNETVLAGAFHSR